ESEATLASRLFPQGKTLIWRCRVPVRPPDSRSLCGRGRRIAATGASGRRVCWHGACAMIDPDAVVLPESTFPGVLDAPFSFFLSHDEPTPVTGGVDACPTAAADARRAPTGRRRIGGDRNGTWPHPGRAGGRLRGVPGRPVREAARG